MTFSLIVPKLFLAGGAFLGSLEIPAAPELMNHTLPGEKIPAAQVVCRSRWGTPMPPDGKAGYSLVAPYKYTPGVTNALIKQSLWIPPVSGKRPEVDVPEVVLPVVQKVVASPLPQPVAPEAALPAPKSSASQAPASAPKPAAVAPQAAAKKDAPVAKDAPSEDDSSDSEDDSADDEPAQ
mgnify:CR=1 FL=1